jgi:hypothetical protein
VREVRARTFPPVAGPSRSGKAHLLRSSATQRSESTGSLDHSGRVLRALLAHFSARGPAGTVGNAIVRVWRVDQRSQWFTQISNYDRAWANT